MATRVKTFGALCLLCVAPLSAAELKFDPAQGWKSLFNGRNIEGWRALDPAKPNDWWVVGGVKLAPANPRFFALQPPGAESGVLVNGKMGKTVNILTADTFGDVEAYIEFVVSKESNSGVYFEGLYEVQILDSFGKKDLAYGDCGGIYARYIDGKVVGGTPPRVNASRPPGAWQNFHVWFRAPRFSAGRKTENARFLKVEHNGVIIHENVEAEGPTRAAMNGPESPTGPLLLQGDHGPVAFRKIFVRPLR